MTMKLVTISFLVSMLLFGCSPQKQPLQQLSPASPQFKSVKKLSFDPVDLSETPVSLQKGEVVIDFQGGYDPYISNYQILATVLSKDKKSPIFHLYRTISVLSSSFSRRLHYNRRSKILSVYSESSMAGDGVLGESRIVCHGVSDTIIFKKAASKATWNTEGDLEQFGCSCQTTNLLKSKKAQKQ